MTERKITRDEWDAIENRGSDKAPRVYRSRECIRCGRLIREGCYSGKDGNWKKHAAACERIDAE